MIVVDRASAVSPYGQIREQLCDLIRAGDLAAGTRLPSIRQLAGDLRVAPGTVARAYTELQELGLIAVAKSGVRVAPDRGLDPAAAAAARQFIELARAASLTIDEALGAIRANWGLGSR